MKPTATFAKRITTRLLVTSAYLLILLTSGCGLAMDSSDRLDRGEEAFAAGDFRAAIIDAKDVLLKEPDNARGRLLLGRASVKVGDGATAEKEFRRAADLGASSDAVSAGLARALLLQRKFQQVLDEVPFEGLAEMPDKISVMEAHAGAYLGLKQPEPARRLYTSVLDLDPESLEAHLGIASTFIAEGNFIQARGGIENILQANADNPRAWIFSGTFHQRVRDFATAEANFEVAHKLAKEQGDNAQRLQALGGLAESLLEQQKTEAARPLVEQLKVEAPQSFQTKVLTARIAVLDKDWTVAQQTLQQILQVAPNFRPAQVLLGAVHLSSGNLSQADMYLTSAVASMPDDIRARQMLAEVRLQMKKADEAQEIMAGVVDNPNADSVSLLMAARASMGLRDVEAALDYLERSVAEDPDNADLKFQLAATLLQANRMDQAQEVLESIDVSGSEGNAYRRDALIVLTAVRDNRPAAALTAAKKVAHDYPDRSGAFNLLGAVQLMNADKEGARKSFQEALATNPADVVSRQYLAELSKSDGDLDGAKSQYETILNDQPEAPWALTEIGKIYFAKRDFASAADHFQRALDKQPDNAGYRLNLARAIEQTGDTDKAAKLLQSSGSNLDHVPSAIFLGTLKAKAGDEAGALDIARRLQKRYPDNPVPHAFEGEIHLVGKDLAKADLAYEAALKRGDIKNHAIQSYRIKRQMGIEGAERPLLDYLEKRPLDNDVRVVLGESYMQSDDLSKSIAAYESAVAREPNNAIALNNLAWTYFLADDPRAIDTAKKAYEAMPGNGAIIDTLGWIMVQQGSLEEGEALLRKAAEIEGNRAEIRYHHAFALARLGRVDEARDILQQVIESDEKFASRKDAEELLAGL